MEAFAQDSTVRLAPGSAQGAPGAAITVALCGHWEHEPPCPLAPHYTSARAVGDVLEVRTLFVADPADEGEVRTRIARALASGTVEGPDGAISQWTLDSSGASDVRADELEHAGRLARS